MNYIPHIVHVFFDALIYSNIDTKTRISNRSKYVSISRYNNFKKIYPYRCSTKLISDSIVK